MLLKVYAMNHAINHAILVPSQLTHQFAGLRFVITFTHASHIHGSKVTLSDRTKTSQFSGWTRLDTLQGKNRETTASHELSFNTFESYCFILLYDFFCIISVGPYGQKRAQQNHDSSLLHQQSAGYWNKRCAPSVPKAPCKANELKAISARASRWRRPCPS